jgi:hypothetical protein
VLVGLAVGVSVQVAFGAGVFVIRASAVGSIGLNGLKNTWGLI